MLLVALSHTGGKFQHATPKELPCVLVLGAAPVTQWNEGILELRSSVGVVDEEW